MEMLTERFPRGAGQIPRATVACYAVAILTAAVSLGVGVINGGARDVCLGLLGAIAGATFWAALGTAVALLAEIADRR